MRITLYTFLRNLWVTALFVTSATALSMDRKFTEILPLKAAMLTKQWQGLLLDVDQKVGIVPELGSTSVGVKRFGPELKRRTLCARQFERCFESTFALATADKNPPKVAQAKRMIIPNLMIDGQARGPKCTTFASLTSPATIALVEQLEDEWSVIALTVNPTERSIETIVAAEIAMLKELRARALATEASLRLHVDARETLAGDSEQLCVTAIGDDEEQVWFQCEG